MHPAGIIGQDESGRLVTLDLLCATPSATSLAAFTDEEYLRHMVARREACRALCAASAERLGRRLYKVIAVIDVAGMSLAHLADHKWHARMKRANDLFAWNYPDSIVQLVVINAPRTFSALWAVASLFLHTLTAAKISVHGASYGKALKDMGLNVPLTPDGKLLHNSITPWVDALEQLKQQRGGSDGSGCGGSLGPASASTDYAATCGVFFATRDVSDAGRSSGFELKWWGAQSRRTANRLFFQSSTHLISVQSLFKAILRNVLL
jgi:hypothetical protein